MATPNNNNPFGIGEQDLLRQKKRIAFIEEAYEKLDDDPSDAIPTKLSELQNDAGYIIEDDLPTVPTKTSDLTNDSAFVTEEQVRAIITEMISGEGGEE